MFEQSTIPPGRASKRLWATCVGVTGEVLLLGCAVLAPMVWPQVLPKTMLFTSLLPPVPPPVRKPEPEQARPRQPKTRPLSEIRMGVLVMPTRFLPHAQILVDPPPEPLTSGGGIPGGLDGGLGSGGGANGLIAGILDGVGVAPPPPRPAAVTRTPEPPAPAPTKRVTIGGRVKPAALISRVEPIYPPIARQMRVAGTVELQGVIGTDGHIRELRVVNGHPLLTRATLDAVSQWVYAPTTLNGELVEVITSITITFHLN